MRYLAIDYGARRLGLATCDESETIVSPHGALLRQNLKSDLRELLQIVRGLSIEGVVFGLPRATENALAKNGLGDSENAAREFAAALQHALNESGLSIEIAWQDERFSTREALNQMKAAGVSQKRGREDLGAQSTDARAAAVILQSFLDARHYTESRALDRVLDSSSEAPSGTPRAEPTDLF